MWSELFRVGDQVVVKIPQENWDWGYRPCEQGSLATIKAFGEIPYERINNFGHKPGYYENRSWSDVVLEDGKEFHISTLFLELRDKEEGERRVAEARQSNDPMGIKDKLFLRDLPETPFWEGDKVRVSGRSVMTSVYREMPPDHDPEVFVVIGIDYGHLGSDTLVGTRYPAYNISSGFGAGWHTSTTEDMMTLVERGNVWKFFHGEKLQFADVKEEATFFEMLGHTEEVRNPANGLFKWELEEVLEAIKQGLVHGFAMNQGLFGGKPSISARRFRDEDLGRRVAQATLEGFKAA